MSRVNKKTTNSVIASPEQQRGAWQSMICAFTLDCRVSFGKLSFLAMTLIGFFVLPGLASAYDCTISDAGGNWNSAASWTGCNSTYPQTGDNVLATATSGNLAVNVNTAYLNSFDLDGYTGTLSGNYNALNIRPANGSTVNVRFAGGYTWIGPVFIDTVVSGDTGTTVNFYTGGKSMARVYVNYNVSGQITISQQDDLTTSGNLILYSGATWTTNNHNINMADLVIHGSGSKTLNAGSSTITISGEPTTYGYWFNDGSNFTFNCGTSTINLTAAGNGTTSNFNGGGLTFYNLNRTGTAVGTDGIQFSGNLTIATGGTLTLSGNGGNQTTQNYRLLVSTTSIGTASTITFTDAISVGTNLVTQYADFRDIAFNASANLSAITGGSGDAGGNSNITFTAADTETWGGSAGSWATKANWTGGTVSRVPLPQDTVALTGTGTVTVNQARLGKDISTNAATPITLSNAVTSYGSVNLSNAGTFSGNYTWTMESQARTGTLTLTNNAKTFYGATFNAYGATIQLADAFTATSTVSLASGTLDAYTNNVAMTFTGAFNSTAGSTLKLGTGLLTENLSNTALAGAVTLYGNATISVATTKILTISGIISESGGARSLAQSGAGQLTLSGANTFTGGLTIKAGTIEINVNAAGTGTITLGDSSGSANATLRSNISATITNPISVASGSSGTLSINSLGGNPYFSGAVTLNNNFTIIAADGQLALTGGVTGSGNIIINNNGSVAAGFSVGSVNNIGTITNSGSGSGYGFLFGVIGTNVTGVIQNSATSALTLSGVNTMTGTLTNSAGTLNITQDATYSTVTVAGDTTTNITAGKTITLANMVSTGTAGHLAIWKSATAAAHTLTTVSGQISTDYLSLTYSQPTQANVWYAGANSTDNGNNGNWIFGAPNTAPGFTAGPSDGSSSSTTPTNAGVRVTFTATATDADADNYYLAVCKTDAITPNNNAAPTCATSQTWAVSTSTVSGAQASVTYTTSSASAESNAWYAFVCDYNAASTCSASSQGTGDSGSPFAVNHAPGFTAIADGTDPIAVGAQQTFTSTASDTDTDGSADTVTLYVCKGNDFTGSACGTKGEWCHSTASASNPTCNYTILTGDGAGTTKSYFGYIFDSHSFLATSNPRFGTFTISGTGSASSLKASGNIKFGGGLKLR